VVAVGCDILPGCREETQRPSARAGGGLLSPSAAMISLGARAPPPQLPNPAPTERVHCTHEDEQVMWYLPFCHG